MIRQGTAEEAPVPVRTGSVYELSLARLIVGAESIVSVIDERSDNSLCGYVQGFGAFGGMSFEQTTRAAYDAMETHSANTMYVVADMDGTALYVGDDRIGGGSGGNTPVNASLSAQTLTALTDKAVKEDI